MKVAVFLPNWIGDVVMATPTLRSLRKHFGPRATIIGIQRPYVQDVLGDTKWLDDVIEFDPKSSLGFGNFKLIRELRRRKIETAILLPNSARVALIAWAAGIPERIGYVRYGRGPLLTERLFPPRSGRKFTPISAIDYYLELSKVFDDSNNDTRVELGTDAKCESIASDFWDRHQLNEQHVVALNTGGAYGAAKSWPDEYFAELANRLANKTKHRIVVVCGPNEKDAAENIVALSEHPNVISLAAQELSIGLTKSVIKRCSLLISTDSGPRFFGAAFDVPTISLFGPTDPRWAKSHHPLAVDLHVDVPCGPCGKRICPLSHHRCMRDISVDDVFDTAMNLLTTSNRNVA